MRRSPAWPAFEAIGPTLAYDHAGIMGPDAAVPTDRAAKVDVPTLILVGSASLPIMPEAARALGQAIPHARVSDMAEQAQMTKQGMAQLVAYLEERSYVERLPDPSDGRAQIVSLTEKGWAVVSVGLRIIQDIEATWTERIGEQRMAALRAALADLAGAAENSS